MPQNTFVLTFAIVNVLVVGLFAATILGQYMKKRRESQLYWTIALGMAFIATLAYMLMILATPTSQLGVFSFRLYYTLGAALTPAWLGLGSLALVTGKRVARTFCLLLGAASLLAVITVSSAAIDMHALSRIAGTPGTGILQPGAWLPILIVLNTLGVVALVVVAMSSGWRLWRGRFSRSDTRSGNVLLGNVLILAGALCNAAAGTLARASGLSSGFWLVMALGWIVFYLGVLLTGKRRSVMHGAPPLEAEESAASA
jgi:hypothetical protein